MPATQGGFAQRPAPIAADADWLDPFPWYRRMREDAPVQYDPDREVWDVFRYDDVKRVLQDSAAFSSEFDQARVVVEAQERAREEAAQARAAAHPSAVEAAEETGEADEAEESPFGRTMITSDPPEHERLRGVVDAAFRPREIAALRPRIEAIAEELLADIPEGTVDIVDAYAYPLPVLVICELLGVPTADRDQVRDWSNTAVSTPPGPDATEAELQADADLRERTTEEMRDYFESLLDERAARPTGDLLSTIAAAETEGRIDREEAVAFCILLLIAGNVTTVTLIGNALWCLQEAGLVDAVRAGDVPLTGTIEEVLRYRSPVQTFFRVAARDVVLGDQQLREGDLVMTWIGAANHDDRQFADPGRFDPARRPNPHLGFGQGRHFCLGAPLARLEAEVALAALLAAFETVEVDLTSLTPVASPVLYGLESLPVGLKRQRVAPAGA